MKKLKIPLSIISMLVFAGCFGTIIEYQETIPIYVQVPITVLLVVYQVLILIKINREK